jgi:hypothetical protein
MAALFTFTTFLAALLLFSVQPLVARMFLPVLGGSPAVWNTAMVFFQAVLLGGYLYAHALGTRLNKGRKLALLGHGLLLLVPFAFLPLAIPAGLTPPATAQPIFWLLGVLALCVGAPFFVLSTSSPLLQRLFALTSHRDARDPYFLYAASNAGSLISLLAYPLYFEPNLALSAQARLWAGLYGVFVVCVGLCCLMVARVPEVPAIEAEIETPPAPISGRRRLRWVVLALVPSSLMLSVTTYLSSDVAAIPLLWIVPLALYLASFMVVFARRPLVPPQFWARALAILILPLVIAIAGRAGEPLGLLVTLHLTVFFLACIVCHGELARDRPPATQLTQFYGWMALGGVIGGGLNALVAPLVFSDVVEYPLSLVALCLLLPRDLLVDDAAKSKQTADTPRSKILDWALPLGVGALCLSLVMALQKSGLSFGPAALGLMFGVPAFLCFAFSRRPLRFGLGIGAILWAGTFYTGGLASRFLDEERSFFGVHRVLLSDDEKFIKLTHGATLHGVGRAHDNRDEPLSYYSRQGPVGDIFALANIYSDDTKAQPLRVAVVGLGGGAVAGYIRRGQGWTFYEIDPKVAQIARDSRYFTFWNDAPTPPQLVLGDARLQLKSAPRGSFDVILLDAYSSDTVPVHLLTREALALYLEKLAPGGIIAWHISNAHFDLEPVVGQLAQDAGLASLTRKDDHLSAGLRAQQIAPSQWAALAHQPQVLGHLRQTASWRTMRVDAPLWTDEKSSLWSLLVRKWGL